MSGGIAELFETHDGLGLGALVRGGEVTASELFEEAVRRTEATNPTLNFLSHAAFEEGRRMAADPNLPDGPFKGVPWLVKELATMWEGLPLTNACSYFKDMVAPLDQETVKRTKQAGFVLLGKSNAPELGWALTTEPALYGPTRSPWNPEHTAGGSSGGSAAAVAARVLPIAEASDGGGSIRAPASICGTVGLKISRGRSTLAPVIADFWYGGAVFFCLSRTVRDTAAYLDAAGGSLPGDPYHKPKPERPFLEEASTDPGTLKIAMVDTAPEGCTPLDNEVKTAVANAAKQLASLGHTVEPEAIPYDFWQLFNIYTRITAVQTAGWLLGMQELVGRPLTQSDVAPLYWTMIQTGKSISGVEHSNDVEQLRLACREVVTRMSAYDVWLMPVVPMTPRKLGYYDMSLDADTYNATVMGPDCTYTAPFNATGQPGISLPLHWTADGLPVGVQFVGMEGDEATLLRLAGQLEQAMPWKDRVPPIHA